jgi:hypothetical protein
MFFCPVNEQCENPFLLEKWAAARLFSARKWGKWQD